MKTNKRNDLVDQRFGRWTVTAVAKPAVYRTRAKTIRRRRVWCRCSCPKATERVVVWYDLLYGKSKSCGCDNRGARTHGMSRSGIHESWKHMWQRCSNPRIREWPWYGGRGIKVCARWNRFEAFLEDMRATWQPGLTLDRINPDKGYTRSNCRWITRAEQQRNRRNNRRVQVDGKKCILAEAAEQLGVCRHALKGLLNRNNGRVVIRGHEIRDEQPKGD